MGTVDIDLGKSGDPTPPFSRSGRREQRALDLMAPPKVVWKAKDMVSRR